MSFWQPGTKQQKETPQQGNEKKSFQHDSKSLKGTPDKDVKTVLSKGVMTMKFMKRKADADMEAVQMAEKRRKQLDSVWTSDGIRHKYMIITAVPNAIYALKATDQVAWQTELRLLIVF